MKEYATWLLTVCILAFGSGPALAENCEISGFYSDMHFIEEAGDWLGIEVFIGYP
ncbi:MAG: hypothetical protein ABIF77_11190 [bacterium]